MFVANMLLLYTSLHSHVNILVSSVIVNMVIDKIVLETYLVLHTHTHTHSAPQPMSFFDIDFFVRLARHPTLLS